MQDKIIQGDKRGTHNNRPSKITEETHDSVTQHINSFPHVESHYCRTLCNKVFLKEENLNIQKMYRRYSLFMSNSDVNLASFSYYRHVFNHEFNISFHQLKKDMCDTCYAFANMAESEKNSRHDEQAMHLLNKLTVRRLMAEDKESAISDESICTACFGVEKTLTTPRFNASMAYYTRKLNIYNFTVYELASHQGTCHVWNETIGGKGANEISSCLWRFIEQKVNGGVKDFRFYSDNCGAQNRNKMLYSMYSRAAKKFDIVITHR